MRTTLRLLGIAALAFPPSSASAEATPARLGLEAFRPAIDSRGYVTVNASQVLEPGALSFGLVTSWGWRVLELEGAGTSYTVENLVTPTLQAAVGLLGVAELGATARFHVLSGDVTAQGVGDLGLHAKLRLLDATRAPVGIALLASVHLSPSRDDDQPWLGDDQPILQPMLVLDRALGRRARFSINAGYRPRRARAFQADGMSVAVDDEVPFGGAVAYALVPKKIEAVGELFGTLPRGGENYQPLEALGALKVYLAASSYFTVGAGVGLVGGAAGANPDARAFLGIVFEPPARERVRDELADEEPAAVPAPTGPTPEPPADRDVDGITDELDGCPDEAEDPDGDRDDDGCPEPDKVVRTRTSLDVLESIYFETDKAVIRPESFAILDAIAGALLAWPDLQLVEIQGHADERGSARHNQELTQARADAVRRYLVEAGVAPARLRAVGYGEDRPLAPGHDEAAWEKNRRVEFRIVRQGGPVEE